MNFRCLKVYVSVALLALSWPGSISAGLIPTLESIRQDRPRLLLRPAETPYAVSLDRLRRAPQDADYEKLLAQLRESRSTVALAMVWLLTGDRTAADSAIARMSRYEEPSEYDTFHIHSRLTEFGLAYDWLCTYDGFTPAVRAEIRRRVMPTAWHGYRNSRDHMFHNYVWMSAGGTAIWTLAVAGGGRRGGQPVRGGQPEVQRGPLPGHALPGRFAQRTPGLLVLLRFQPLHAHRAGRPKRFRTGPGRDYP
ncbi:MAG: hypothetical protein V1794_05785 [Candidatus Glassbacteria bacterium]